MWLIVTGGELEPHTVSARESRILCSEHMYEQDLFATGRTTCLLRQKTLRLNRILLRAGFSKRHGTEVTETGDGMARQGKRGQFARCTREVLNPPDP